MRKFAMRARWSCLAIAPLFLLLAAAPASSQAVAPPVPRTPVVRPGFARTFPAYRVLRVVDGDTVVLKMDGKTVKARLIGVDTPETVHPSKPVERFGKEASAFLKGLIEGKDVAVEYEAGPSALDNTHSRKSLHPLGPG